LVVYTLERTRPCADGERAIYIYIYIYMYRRNDRAVNIRHTHILFETLGKKRERERKRDAKKK